MSIWRTARRPFMSHRPKIKARAVCGRIRKAGCGSEWNSGNVSVFDPTDKSWKQWKLPGEKPRTYAVWVDPNDMVWLSEWAANAIVRFDPATEKFESFPSNRKNANVRQMLGRKGETWIAESGTERIRVIRHPVGTN